MASSRAVIGIGWPTASSGTYWGVNCPRTSITFAASKPVSAPPTWSLTPGPVIRWLTPRRLHGTTVSMVTRSTKPILTGGWGETVGNLANAVGARLSERVSAWRPSLSRTGGPFIWPDQNAVVSGAQSSLRAVDRLLDPGRAAPPWHGSRALVPLWACHWCHSAIRTVTWIQPALLTHGGYGAATRYRLRSCRCGAVRHVDQQPVNPRRLTEVA